MKRCWHQCCLGFVFHKWVCTMNGSLYISGKLPTYPSPKPTLTITSHLGKNVGLREGYVGSFSMTPAWVTILAFHSNHLKQDKNFQFYKPPPPPPKKKRRGDSCAIITWRAPASLLSSCTTDAKASGFTPASHSLTQTAKDSVSRPVFSSLEISTSAKR